MQQHTGNLPIWFMDLGASMDIWELPACAYHAIRKEFSIESDNFTGYKQDDE